MAMSVSEVERSADELMQFTQGETVLNCTNCVLMEKQLHSVMMELKSAQEIISLLNEDIKNNTRGSVDDVQHRLSSRETSESEISRDNQTNEKWTSIMYKRKKQ
jgi:Zn-finger protein